VLLFGLVCQLQAQTTSQVPSNPQCRGTINGYQFDLSPLQNPSTDYVINGVNRDGKNPWQITLNVCQELANSVTPSCSTGAVACQRWDMPNPSFRQTLGVDSAMETSLLHQSGEDARFLGREGVVVNWLGGTVTSYKVNFICNRTVSGVGQPTAYSVLSQYIIDWNTPYACNLNSGGGGGLSGGSILLIILLCVVVVYLVGGVLVNKFVRKQEGFVELIPNSSFWTGLPSLVKDGGLFVVHKIRGGNSYQAVK